MPNPINIMAAVNDPGGTQALLPVLAALNADPAYRLRVAAGPLAGGLFVIQGLPFEPVGKDMTAIEAAEFCQRYQPDILLTGTSWQADMEQQLRNQAHLWAIPSVVVLDFWSNYALRWDGTVYPIENLADTVCVPDDMTVNEMIAAGFPKRKLAPTGQPFLEEMFSKGASEPDKAESGNTLFLSQPSVTDGQTISQSGHLERVVEALTEIAKEKNRGFILKIKLHPKEAANYHWQTLALTLTNDFCGVEIAEQHKNIAEYLAWAEHIIGYNTMAQFQARAMGKQTISIRAYDVPESLKLAMHKAGIVTVSKDLTGLRQALAADADPPYRDFHQGATTNILAVIKTL